MFEKVGHKDSRTQHSAFQSAPWFLKIQVRNPGLFQTVEKFQVLEKKLGL